MKSIDGYGFMSLLSIFKNRTNILLKSALAIKLPNSKTISLWFNNKSRIPENSCKRLVAINHIK